MINPIIALGDSLDRSVERISRRAFESAQRDEPKRQPSRQQMILKAVQERRASPGEIQEARDFGLVKDVHGQVELTPLGRYIFSGYPERDTGQAQTASVG